MPTTAIPVNGATTVEWFDGTARDKCPICKHPDWCRVSKDKLWVACRRERTGADKEKTDSAGNIFYVHYLGTKKSNQPEARFSMADGGGKRAKAEILDRVYRIAINSLP